jgi:hypothetical protein
MTIDRALGFIGVIIALFGLGATYLWPNKKWIGVGSLALGVLTIGWALTMLRSPCAEATSSEVFSGVVLDQANHRPIAGADVLVAQDQAVPEVLHSDDHGIFAVRLHPGVVSLRINVSANGYVPEVRTTSPTRTGPEEFQLKPTSQSVMSRPQGKPNIHQTAPHTPADQPSQPAQMVINQNNQGPSIGINNGTANFYLGNPPPPIRNVNPDNVTDSIATLRVAVAGTKLRIDGVGESADLESFVNQMVRLFQLGGWTPFKGNRTPEYTSGISDSSGTTISHGEGILCFFQNPNVGFIAKRALEQIGYPCQGYYTPQYTERFPADFYLSIGGPTN